MKRPSAARAGSLSALYASFVKAGARYCAGCRSYALPALHICDGTPVISRVMGAPTQRREEAA